MADGAALAVSEGVTEALAEADAEALAEADTEALAEADTEALEDTGSTASSRALDDAQPASRRAPATARTHRRGFTRRV